MKSKQVFALLLLLSIGNVLKGVMDPVWEGFESDILAAPVSDVVLKAAEFGKTEKLGRLVERDLISNEIVLVPRTAGGYSYGLFITYYPGGALVNLSGGKQKVINYVKLGYLPMKPRLVRQIDKKQLEG